MAFEIIFQLNGKYINTNIISDESEIQNIVDIDSNIQKLLDGKEIKNIITIKDKLVNIIT